MPREISTSVRTGATRPAAAHLPGVNPAHLFFARADAAEALHLYVMERAGLELTDDEAERNALLRPHIPAEVLGQLERADVFTSAIELFGRVRAHFGAARFRQQLVQSDSREGLFLMAKAAILGLTETEQARMAVVNDEIQRARLPPGLRGDSATFGRSA